MSASITSHIDVAQVVLYTFWLFFAGLIFYLRREDRREGYPLESEFTGKPYDEDSLLIPSKKVFTLASGEQTDSMRRDKRELKLAPTQAWTGAPFEPTGDPMVDGVGPASWAERRDVVERTADGHAKIAPMRSLPDFMIAKGDTDPRGLPVKGCDGVVAGTVTDVWIDHGEQMIRYLEVELSGQSAVPGVGGALLLPMAMAKLTGYPAYVRVVSIRGDQFAGVPRTKSPGEVTLLEEEKVVAYYAGGYLYAEPSRMGPLI